MPKIIKQDGSRQPFDEQKLRAGIMRSVEKRHVSVDDIEESIATIMSKLRATGERELPANTVGEMVMHQLRKLDDVAYVRFASVYRSFQDVDSMAEEIQQLLAHKRREEELRNQIPLPIGEE